MKLQYYPQLGQLVTFVQADQNTGALVEGKGRILAIAMDGAKRPIAHLEHVPNPEGKPNFNVDLNALNPSEEFKVKLKTCVETVLKLSAEGNAKVGAVVGDYNKQVEDQYTGVLGAPVVFEQPEEVSEEAAQKAA
jgi:hypothetical protein